MNPGITKTLFCVLLTFRTLTGVADHTGMQAPVYPPVHKDVDTLQRLCAPYLSMSREELLALVPPQPGFLYCGSPLTNKGTQDHNISWKLADGDKVLCRFTGTLLPNDKYPENGYIELTTPTGKKQRFNYHQDARGKKYWFEARKWYEQRELMEQAAYLLAQLYRADPGRQREAGLRSVAIMKRFAEVFPDYIIKYDYPAEDKLFFDEAAYKKASEKIDHYFIRLTRWTRWGYSNLSRTLVLAYDQLQQTEVLPAADQAKIIGLFDGMIAFTSPFARVPLTNMHPFMWESEVIASLVLDRPEMAGKVLNGINRMLREQYTYDGFYKEATVSYSNQTIRGLKRVLGRLYPALDEEALESRIKAEYPALYMTFKSHEAFRLPNGGYASLNDTWAKDRYGEPIAASRPALMPGIGHAVLGSGDGPAQVQAHVNYSGRFGHDHYGSLGLILFAKGRELVSDLGYTHTRARLWVSATASHNTVVVDGKSQLQGEDTPRKGMGDLLLYQAEDPGFQVMEVRADEVYPEEVTDYRRTLIAVRIDEDDTYTVDLFHVKGGDRHDWMLHGSADEQQTLEVMTAKGKEIPFRPVKSLVPEGVSYEDPQGQYADRSLLWVKDWVYGHFRNVRQGQTAEPVRAVFRYTSDPALGMETWLTGSAARQVMTASSWNVRGAAEDQGILDDHLRQSLIVRRKGGDNRFVAVHVPFRGNSPVTAVEQLPLGSGAMVRIDYKTGRDYILYQPENRKLTVEIEGKKYLLEGRAGLIRIRAGKTVSKMLAPVQAADGTLLAAGKEGLTVKGDFRVKPGQVIRIVHGDGHTTPYHVEKAERSGSDTRIVTREPVTLQQRPNGRLKLDSFPFAEFAGPHIVESDRLIVR